MPDPERSQLQLAAPREKAVAAIRAVLPSDAVVRDEDDAVGRFASDRTVMIVGRGERKLMLFQGSWRSVKARADKPHLQVDFVDEAGDSVTVELTRAAVEKPRPLSRVLDVVGNMATVGILVVAYHLFRKLPVDRLLVAGISVGGGIAWSAIAHFWPKKETAGLEGMVRRALRPLLADQGDE